MSNEVRIWKEVIVVYFEVLPHHSSMVTEKTHEIRQYNLLTRPMGAGILLAIASRPVLGSMQPHIQWSSAMPPSPWIKWPAHEADHWPPSTAKVKNAWNYTSNPQNVFMAWLAQGKLYFVTSLLPNEIVNPYSCSGIVSHDDYNTAVCDEYLL
jgi:hypothetical protein